MTSARCEVADEIGEVGAASGYELGMEWSGEVTEKRLKVGSEGIEVEPGRVQRHSSSNWATRSRW